MRRALNASKSLQPFKSLGLIALLIDFQKNVRKKESSTFIQETMMIIYCHHCLLLNISFRDSGERCLDVFQSHIRSREINFPHNVDFSKPYARADRE